MIFVLLSLFSTVLARHLLDVDKCESCKVFVGGLQHLIENHEVDIGNYITTECPESTCVLLAEDNIKTIKGILGDPGSVCEELRVCPRTTFNFFW